MIDIARALQIGWPQGKWSLIGNDYSRLTWIGPGDAPTMEELQEAWDNRPPPPIVVSMRSFREACGRDLVIKINAYVASIPDAYERFSVQNDLEYALTVARDHPKVAQVAAAIGKTESEIDEVFALAQYLDSK